MRIASWTITAALCLAASTAFGADRKYGPGVSDTEIKIGQTMPYSGPLSAYGAIGKAEAAYFKMVNEKGGVNGRKIDFVTLDDGYQPPKTVEVTRKLVEEDQVLGIVGSLGTPTNVAIHKYLNGKQVPQLFVATGATEWGDPEHFPWTMGWQPSYQVEGHIYARYIMKNLPNTKVAVLYQNDDAGKDYLKGITDGFGDKAGKFIVKAVSYEVTDPTVDSQVVTLQSSGADTFFNPAAPKQAAQAIRKAYDVGWKPKQFLGSISASVQSVLKPAGFEKAAGLITAAYLKDPTDKTWANDPAYKDWLAWMKKYNPEGSVEDSFNVYGYTVAMTVVKVLQKCGNDLTRENLMKQAANMNFELPMLLPGIKVNTAPTNFFPVHQMHLQKFDGEKWILFGDVIGG
ncbi:MAG TPA: ABC transporter substrate-binding protein [Candidatus Cybelea sp.]|nr:ABC transporter substrate-binding protein [Candidatus Cybelea sp.]